MNLNEKNIIEFYTLADKLKSQNRFGSSQSYSSNNFGGMLIAYLYNIEHSITNDISKVLRIIAMSNMLTINTSARNIFENMNKGKQYMSEIYEYYAQDSIESIFALSCREYDNSLSKLFDKYNNEKVNDLYETFKNNKIIPNNIDLKNIFDIYSFEKQKSIAKVNSDDDLAYGSIILALALDSEGYNSSNIDRVIEMLLLSKLDRKNLSCIDKNGHIKSILEEYDENKTKDSIFANYCNNLELNMQNLNIESSNLDLVKLVLTKGK